MWSTDRQNSRRLILVVHPAIPRRSGPRPPNARCPRFLSKGAQSASNSCAIREMRPHSPIRSSPLLGRDQRSRSDQLASTAHKRAPIQPDSATTCSTPNPAPAAAPPSPISPPGPVPSPPGPVPPSPAPTPIIPAPVAVPALGREIRYSAEDY